MDTQNTTVVRKLYDGAQMCSSSCCCPIVEQLTNGMVRIHDPAKPENGTFTMTAAEYNLLLANATPAR